MLHCARYSHTRTHARPSQCLPPSLSSNQIFCRSMVPAEALTRNFVNGAYVLASRRKGLFEESIPVLLRFDHEDG